MSPLYAGNGPCARGKRRSACRAGVVHVRHAVSPDGCRADGPAAAAAVSRTADAVGHGSALGAAQYRVDAAAGWRGRTGALRADADRHVVDRRRAQGSRALSPQARRLLDYMQRYRRSFVVGFACVIAASTISLTGPWVLKYAIDDLNRGVTAAKVQLYGGLLLLLAASGGFFRFLMRRVIVGASRDFEYDLRNDFFAALQRQHAAYFQQHRTGDLMSRATNDPNAVRMMNSPAVMYTSSTGLPFVIAIAMAPSTHPKLTQAERV